MTYELDTAVPSVAEYRQLRAAAGLSPRTEEAARRGLQNTVHGVTARTREEVVGMGRIVGDDGCVYQIVDVAVHPSEQGNGLGSRVVRTLVDFLQTNAPPSAYVCLIADVDGFYEQFGFEKTTPQSKAMSMTIE